MRISPWIRACRRFLALGRLQPQLFLRRELHRRTGGDIRVRRVHAVVDCGFAIDPPNVVALVRSAINFGLSAALFGKIEFDQGKVVQSNFDSYPVLTLDNAPDITVEIVNSGAEIGGIGEIGTPGIAPAVANAIFVATGRRLRSLPFT